MQTAYNRLTASGYGLIVAFTIAHMCHIDLAFLCWLFVANTGMRCVASAPVAEDKCKRCSWCVQVDSWQPGCGFATQMSLQGLFHPAPPSLELLVLAW